MDNLLVVEDIPLVAVDSHLAAADIPSQRSVYKYLVKHTQLSIVNVVSPLSIDFETRFLPYLIEDQQDKNLVYFKAKCL